MQLTTGLAAASIAAPAVSKRTLRQAPDDTISPPKSAKEARLIWARLVGDLSGRPIFFFTHGTVWGFRPQADDLTLAEFAKRLYGYSGIAARQMQRQTDGSIMIRQKYWAFYRDPVTDAITDSIPNPYTNATDKAAPMSGPEAVRPLEMGAGPDGAMPYNMRIRRLGQTATIDSSSFARFKPADTDWYKLEGNLEDYVCRVADLDSPDATHIPNYYSQNVIAEWQTWTKMHGTPGHILFKGNGEPLTSLDQVPADQISAIEKFFPGTLKTVRAWR